MISSGFDFYLATLLNSYVSGDRVISVEGLHVRSFVFALITDVPREELSDSGYVKAGFLSELLIILFSLFKISIY